MSESSTPEPLTGSSASPVQIDDAAVVWSVPREEVSERLAEQPLVIVMHGRGSHENDLPGLYPFLPGGLVFASLRAPLSGEPYGLGGYTWFTPSTADGPPRESVDAAVSAVLAWLDRVEREFGAPPAIVALGFSQGGMMSIELMRTAPSRFAAAVNLSGASASGEVAGDGGLAERRPPLFWGRDVGDPIIDGAAIARTEAFVPGHFTVTSRLYPGIEHSVSRTELADVSGFLAEALGLADG
jgi:phospholipase/carboxylesterase